MGTSAAQPRDVPRTAVRRARRGPLVLAVDVGSSSVRAALYDTAGRRRPDAFCQVAYRPDVDDHGGVSVPAERLLGVVGQAIDGLVERSTSELPRVVAAGISCFLHSLVGVDRAGRPVTPVFSWADTTAASEADGLRRSLDGPALWEITGAPLHTSYWPARVVRLRAREEPAAGFTGAPALIWQVLTGERGLDLSQASGTGLLERRTGEWHAPLLDALRLTAAELPPILPAFASAPLTRAMAARWPGLAHVRWFAAWSDAWCGNVGLGAAAGGPAALQVGTSGAIRIVLEHLPASVPPGLFNHRLPDGTALLGGQLSEGGGVAAGIAGLLGSTPARLERVALALPPDGHGLTVLPYLAGERGPGYHGRARGVVAGLTLGTSPAEVYLATIEAIALRFAALDARLVSAVGGRPRVLASGGAIARSKLLPAVLAAALGRPLEVSSEGEASARGAALLALVGAGILADVRDVPAPASRPVEPDAARAAAYVPAAERQEALYAALLGSEG